MFMLFVHLYIHISIHNPHNPLLGRGVCVCVYVCDPLINLCPTYCVMVSFLVGGRFGSCDDAAHCVLYPSMVWSLEAKRGKARRGLHTHNASERERK